MSQATNIKVAVRIRPMVPDEESRNALITKLQAPSDGQSIQIINEKKGTCKQYKFDKVFDSTATQERLFDKARISYLVKQVVSGFHATVFVYGQTGSGKTYTMEGYRYAQQNGQVQAVLPKSFAPSESEGLIPRAIRDLFSQIQAKREETSTCKIQVQCSYVQLYNEKIYDLLNQQKHLGQPTALKLKWSANDDFYIENAYCFEITNEEDGLHYFWMGIKNKMMASHKINNSSSRSHCILSFTMTQIDINQPDNIITSKLQLVDLAGSERQSHTQTQTDPTLLKESIEINKSLFTLRQVITALTDKNQSQVIPYRESKLTSILRQSLGGNSYCLMIACLAPVDDYVEENLSTLNYASRAAYIANVPTINQDPRLKLIQEQQKQIEFLQNELKKANGIIKVFTNGDQQPPVCQQCSKKQDPTSPGSISITNQVNLSVNGNAPIGLSNLFGQQTSPTNQLPSIQARQADNELVSPTKLDKEATDFLNQKSEALKNLTFDVANPSGVTDRLIYSISMIKDVLQSNLVLREDLLNTQQDQDRLQKVNKGLKIENEDLRDRLQLIDTPQDGNALDLINKAKDLNDLHKLKSAVIHEIYSAKKNNSDLHKKIEDLERDKMKLIIAQKRRHSRDEQHAIEANRTKEHFQNQDEPQRSLLDESDFAQQNRTQNVIRHRQIPPLAIQANNRKVQKKTISKYPSNYNRSPDNIQQPLQMSIFENEERMGSAPRDQDANDDWSPHKQSNKLNTQTTTARVSEQNNSKMSFFIQQRAQIRKSVDKAKSTRRKYSRLGEHLGSREETVIEDQERTIIEDVININEGRSRIQQPGTKKTQTFKARILNNSDTKQGVLKSQQFEMMQRPPSTQNLPKFVSSHHPALHSQASQRSVNSRGDGTPGGGGYRKFVQNK